MSNTKESKAICITTMKWFQVCYVSDFIVADILNFSTKPLPAAIVILANKY